MTGSTSASHPPVEDAENTAAATVKQVEETVQPVTDTASGGAASVQGAGETAATTLQQVEETVQPVTDTASPTASAVTQVAAGQDDPTTAAPVLESVKHTVDSIGGGSAPAFGPVDTVTNAGTTVANFQQIVEPTTPGGATPGIDPLASVLTDPAPEKEPFGALFDPLAQTPASFEAAAPASDPGGLDGFLRPVIDGFGDIGDALAFQGNGLTYGALAAGIALLGAATARFAPIVWSFAGCYTPGAVTFAAKSVVPRLEL